MKKLLKVLQVLAWLLVILALGIEWGKLKEAQIVSGLIGMVFLWVVCAAAWEFRHTGGRR